MNIQLEYVSKKMSNAYTQNNHNFSTVQNIPAINFPVKSFPVKTLAKSDQNGRVTTGIFSTDKVYVVYAECISECTYQNVPFTLTSLIQDALNLRN